jgi:hypothetical protein
MPPSSLRQTPAQRRLSCHYVSSATKYFLHCANNTSQGLPFLIQWLVNYNYIHTSLGDILGMRNVLHEFGQPQLDGIILIDHASIRYQQESAQIANCARMFVDFFKANVTRAIDLEDGALHVFERAYVGVGGHDFACFGPDHVSPGDFVTYRAEWYKAVGLDVDVHRHAVDRPSRYRHVGPSLTPRAHVHNIVSAPHCRAAFIANKRRFDNHDDIIGSLNSTLHEMHCSFDVVDWKDMPTMREQLQTAQNIDIYITSVGTGALNAVFLPRGAVVVHLGWLEIDPGHAGFNAPLGGFMDAYLFPALSDIRSLYCPLPISRLMNVTMLNTVIKEAVQVFRSGFAKPVLRVDNQDPWSRACAVIFKADESEYHGMLSSSIQFCEPYLIKAHNITTLGQLERIAVGEH